MGILLDKYSIEYAVNHKSEVEIGDQVVYIEPKNDEEVVSYVVDFIDGEDYKIIAQKEPNLWYCAKQIVDLIECSVFKLRKDVDPVRECSCGAKYTSNPKYHLSYCCKNKK